MVSLVSNRARAGLVFAVLVAIETVVFYAVFPPPGEALSLMMLCSFMVQPILSAVGSFAALSQRNRIVEATKTASDVRMKCLANLSHDLRTPLNAALGISAILGQGDVSDGQRELLESLESQVTLLLLLLFFFFCSKFF